MAATTKASFFGRLKSATGTTGNAGSAPAKKDPNAPQPTPLEKLLADAGPLRTDGSDKFFGFENFGSTCYCNSIIQCLYYSVPFREQVINFPTRSPQDPLRRKLASNQIAAAAAEQPGRTSLAAKSAPAVALQSASPRTKQSAPAAAQNGPPKPEDNKDSPEYKKKVALATGPVLNMDFENAMAYGMAESLFTSLKDIFEAVIAHDSRMGIVSPHKFLEILRRDNEMFRTPMHQDAHEFLNLLLNQVVENVEQYSRDNETNGKVIGEVAANGLADAVAPVVNSIAAPGGLLGAKMSSRWVHELFEGTLTSETRCLTCENVSQRDEPFLDLSVDLENHNSVTSCLRRFSEEEMLCERNKFHCDKCSGLQEAEKRMKIKRLPRILALHLKRFKYTEDMQRLQKLFHRVVYPYYLRLFNTTDDAEDPDRLYELYAVVVHIGGGPYHGHYVSIIKTQDRGWLLFDDEMVEPVDKRFVTKFFGEGLDVLGHPKNLACAYVLFYQETTVEAMQRELDSEGVPPAATSANAPKDPLAARANGFASNGAAHPPAPSTPLAEDVEQFASLDHAATAPAVQSPQLAAAPFANPLEPTPTSPNLAFLKRKKSKGELTAKEEQKRLDKEEKERKKAEDKEAERLAKLKKKEAEAVKKEGLKKHEEELAAAAKTRSLSRSLTTPAASSSNTTTSSRTEDEPVVPSVPVAPVGASVVPIGASVVAAPATVAPAAAPAAPAAAPRPTGLGLTSDERELSFSTAPHPRENGGPPGPAIGSGTMLHRFRNTSMSLSRKGHFWSKDKDREKARKSEDLPVREPTTPEEQLNESLLGGGGASPDLRADGKKKESRFGLGRKKSVNLLSRNHH